MNVDPTGEFFITALVVGVIAGATIGGAVGGKAAYESAKASGSEGSDLFWKTVKGVGKGAGKGATIGAVVGGFVGAGIGAVGAHIATSNIGVALTSTAINVASRTAEVGILQARKSLSEGQNIWQVLDNSVDSIWNNSFDILKPVFTKSFTLAITGVVSKVVKRKSASEFLMDHNKGTISYLLAAKNVYYAIDAFSCYNPVIRAEERGYVLK